uniref:CCHC-type domain-containing protein n=1 Tax=Tanacetum cinerariifolium TaxID=118510 RepID=A0A6L2NFR8_TANCI|nr:hypothetical protein [Tanacetum cinerariifolium]
MASSSPTSSSTNGDNLVGGGLSSNVTLSDSSNFIQNQGYVNDALGYKKKVIVITSDPLELVAEKTKEGHFAKDCKKAKVKDYNYYKTKMLLPKKDSDEQVFLAEDQAWMEFSSDSDQEINANMVFMAQIEKVLWIFVQDNMIRDVITVGSIMKIPLLYRGEYSQWRERFMNYLEEKTDDEAMINSIQNGDQPLPVIAKVSPARTAQNAPPTLKDLKFWTAEEKKTRKIDRLARSFLIQGISNDIYSLIDSNETMRSSDYGEQDRKAAILYEYETFKATEGEQLLDTYLRYLQVINNLKKCGYKKDNCELNYKFLNNLQPEWKQYGTLMRQTKNLMDINIDSLYNILKKNQGAMNDAFGYKKKVVVVTLDLLALVAEKTKMSKRKKKVKFQTDSEGSDDEDISANKKAGYVKSVEKKEDKKADEKKRDMSKVKCYNYKKEGHFAKDCKKAKVKDYNYYKKKMLQAKKDNDEQVLLAEDQAWMESSSDSDKEINANMVFMAQIEKVIILGYTPMFFIHADEALEIEKFKRARENKIEFAYVYGNLNASYVNEKINFSDDYFQEIINPYFKKIDSPFQQTSSLKPYVSTIILEKIIINLEYEVVSLLKKEKENLETIEPLKSKGFESSENTISESENQSENDYQVVEKECDQVENSKVIAPGMFKLSVSQSVSPILMSKTSCDSKNVENKTKRKRHLDTFSSVRGPKQSSVI